MDPTRPNGSSGGRWYGEDFSLDEHYNEDNEDYGEDNLNQPYSGYEANSALPSSAHPGPGPHGVPYPLPQAGNPSFSTPADLPVHQSDFQQGVQPASTGHESQGQQNQNQAPRPSTQHIRGLMLHNQTGDFRNLIIQSSRIYRSYRESYLQIRREDMAERNRKKAETQEHVLGRDFPTDAYSQQNLIRHLCRAIANLEGIIDRKQEKTKKKPGKTKKGTAKSGDEPEDEPEDEEEGDANEGGSHELVDAHQVRRVRSLSNVEIELLAWKILLACREAQDGQQGVEPWVNNYSWDPFPNFMSRFEAVVESCRNSKSFVKSMLNGNDVDRLAAGARQGLERIRQNIKGNEKKKLQMALGKKKMRDDGITFDDKEDNDGPAKRVKKEATGASISRPATRRQADGARGGGSGTTRRRCRRRGPACSQQLQAPARQPDDDHRVDPASRLPLSREDQKKFLHEMRQRLPSRQPRYDDEEGEDSDLRWAKQQSQTAAAPRFPGSGPQINNDHVPPFDLGHHAGPPVILASTQYPPSQFTGPAFHPAYTGGSAVGGPLPPPGPSSFGFGGYQVPVAMGNTGFVPAAPLTFPAAAPESVGGMSGYDNSGDLSHAHGNHYYQGK